MGILRHEIGQEDSWGICFWGHFFYGIELAGQIQLEKQRRHFFIV